MQEIQNLLGGIEQIRVLNKYENGDLVAYLGLVKDEKILVIIETKMGDFVLNQIKTCHKIMQNDRFSKFFCKGGGAYRVSVIFPALEEDIQKYAPSEKIRIIESYENYKKNIEPTIQDQNLDWITNIFNGVSERNRVLHSDEHFVLLMDMKWDGRNPNCLYCVALFKDTSLKSIRNLTSAHVPLIEHVYSTSIRVIKEKYGIEEEHLRSYFHYHPSFWQLHAHFNLTKNKISGSSIDVAHSLSNVVGNLKIKDDFYQTCDIPIVIKQKVNIELFEEPEIEV